MGPGVHLRGTVDYDAIEAINQSSLKRIAKSPLHYQHGQQGSTETPSQFRGTTAHTAILEPERFMLDYALFSGPRRAGKEWKAFQEANSNKTIVKQSDFDQAMAMRDAVHSHPIASHYLKAEGDVEATLVWDDAETGTRCKGRPDFIAVAHTIVDIKTTKDAAPHWFGRDAFNFGYHVQAAFYSDGYEAIVHHPVQFVIIAVESKAPYDVVVFTLDDETLGIGRDAYRDMLVRLKECQESGVWPGQAAEASVPLVLPPWAKQNDDDLSDLGLE